MRRKSDLLPWKLRLRCKALAGGFSHRLSGPEHGLIDFLSAGGGQGAAPTKARAVARACSNARMEGERPWASSPMARRVARA